MPAVGAVPEGAGICVLKVGAFRRWSEALAAQARAGAKIGAPQVSLVWEWKIRFVREGLLPVLTAQQWAFLRSRGTVEVAFRELPTEAAALFLDALDERQADLKAAKAEPMDIDPTRPDLAMVQICTDRDATVSLDPRDRDTAGFSVECQVALKSGSRASF